MKRNRKRLSSRLPVRLGAILLIVALTLCMMPGAGLMAGSTAVYAAENELIGVVSAASLQTGGDYALAGDTVIQLDDDAIIGSLNVGSHELTIENYSESEDHYLSVWGTGITGTSGIVNLNSGYLDVDLSSDSGRYPTAIYLPTGTLNVNGGGLNVVFGSNNSDAEDTTAIIAKSFNMSGGTATISATPYSNGHATGLSTNDFRMTGGSMGVTADTSSTGDSATGISANGSSSNSDFYMSGGELRAEGKSSGESYGIYWSADATQNHLEVAGGKLNAIGKSCGIFSWVHIYVSDGAQVEATADGTAIQTDDGDLFVTGATSKVTAHSNGSSGAINLYKGEFGLADYIKIKKPEGGYIGEYGSEHSHTVYDTLGNSATHVELGADLIPTNIALTYDTSKAFATTRLTGHQVSLHFLRSITSNPGESNASDGWYVYSADPNKTDTITSKFTCLVRKDGDSFETLENSDEPLSTSEEYYFCFNIERDGSRVFDTNATYNVTVNGEPADYIHPASGPEGGDMCVYKRAYMNETDDLIWSLKVGPLGSKIVPGGSRQFSVTTIAATTDEVNWSVTGNSSSSTYITSSGVLNAASDEAINHYITVKATSKVDPAVYDEVNVEVVDEVPSIESVTLECDKTIVCRGSNADIYATVVGTDIHDLTWELSGSDGNSYFNGGSNTSRYLTVGSSETSDQLTVKATSVADPTKYDTWVFTVTDKETVTGPIEITYDESAVTLSESKTGKEVSDAFRAAITSPFGSGLKPDTAPGGWYVYGSPSDPSSRWTCLVKKNGSGYVELFNSEENLSPDNEYYLWFNIEPCSNTHQFDPHMSILDLGITVNGHRVNGDTVKAEWGGTVEVYVRVYLPGQEPDSTDVLERIYGANRFDTAFEAADWLKAEMGVDRFPAIVIASGLGFPDALAGAYLAEAKDAPVLLTSEGTASSVAEYVKNNMAPDGTVYILGGTGAVPEAMEQQLLANGITEDHINRLAGTDRYQTNILILQEAGVSGQDILVCAGTGYADSLSASGVGKPILLVGKTLTEGQKEYLASVKDSVSGDFCAIGGTGVVSDDVLNEVKAYANGSCQRVAGANRFATSVAVAETFFPSDIDSIVLAYAMNYPDGLAGGPVAYIKGAPLLLVNDANYDLAHDYVVRTNAIKVRVMGGPTLISDATALAILDL